MAFEKNTQKGHVISTGNSSTGLLASGASFSGTWEDVTDYTNIACSILGSMVTSGTLWFDLSTDGGSTYTSVPRTIDDTTFALPRVLNVVETHVRIRYVNGDTAMSGTFSLQTKYSNGQAMYMSDIASATIDDNTDIQNVRAIGTGKTTDGDYKNAVVSAASSGNSSTTNLTSGTSLTYTGTWTELEGYHGITVLVDGTAAGTVGGTLQMQFSHDGVTVNRNIQVSNTDVANVPPRTLGVVAKYFRIIYTADSDLTSFDIQTMFHTTQVQLVSRLDQTLQGIEDVTNTRAAIVGETYGGTFKNVTVDNEGRFRTSVPLTAFGDLRTAELSPIYQLSFEYTVDNTEIGFKTIEGSGTVTQENAMLNCTTTSNSGSLAQWETTHHAKYRAGMGGVMRFTACFTSGASSGSLQAVGLIGGDGSGVAFNDGYAIGYDGPDFGFIRFVNDTKVFTAVSGWDDPLDGTGDSGINIDPTKLNVFFIEFQYLGAGAIKIWVEDSSSGDMVLAHTVAYANLNTAPSVYNPNFSLKAVADNNGNAENLVVKSASMGYFIEGKSKFTELQQPHFTSEKIEATSVTTEVPVFTIRNKTSYASKVNYIDLVLENIVSSAESSAQANIATVRIIKNTTLGGSPSWSDISTSNSFVEIDTSGTSVSGGTTLFSADLAGKNDKDNSSLLPYEFIISPGDTITVAAESANSSTINASLLWKELF